MKTWKFEGLWQGKSWLESAYVTLDKSGKVVSIEPNSTKPFQSVEGWAIPGFQNAHSHAFQYAMAGETEYRGSNQGQDDFWSWRNTMYALALKLSPDEIKKIAFNLYRALREQGFTAVAEFHYLHRDVNGQRYSNPNEIAESLIAAAQSAGVNLTLVPVYYHSGNFGVPPSEKQKRFLYDSVDQYFSTIEKLKQTATNHTGVKIGIGVHSLRAAPIEDVKKIFAYDTTTPKHIHIAEQLKEVNDCLNFTKKRPIEYLLENASLNSNCHLVHATHASEQELKAIAKCGANVVLCPSTEANLGDGLFPLVEYVKTGGRWSIGTDSHVGISALEELRWLSYGQRLRHQKRSLLSQGETMDEGTVLLNESIETGNRAMGVTTSQDFKPGDLFDVCILDSKARLFETCPKEHRLSKLIFAGDANCILGTLIQGQFQWRVNTQSARADNP